MEGWGGDGQTRRTNLRSTYVILCHLMSSYVILCHLMSSYVFLCHLMSSYVILCHLMSSYVIVCHLKGYCKTFKLFDYRLTHLLTYWHVRPSPLKMLNFTTLFWGLPLLSNLINCFTIVDIKYTCIAYKIYFTMACCNTTTTSLVTFTRTVAFYQQLVQSGTQEYKGIKVRKSFRSLSVATQLSGRKHLRLRYKMRTGIVVRLGITLYQ